MCVCVRARACARVRVRKVETDVKEMGEEEKGKTRGRGKKARERGKRALARARGGGRERGRERQREEGGGEVIMGKRSDLADGGDHVAEVGGGWWRRGPVAGAGAGGRLDAWHADAATIVLDVESHLPIVLPLRTGYTTPFSLSCARRQAWSAEGAYQPCPINGCNPSTQRLAERGSRVDHSASVRESGSGTWHRSFALRHPALGSAQLSVNAQGSGVSQSKLDGAAGVSESKLDGAAGAERHE